MSIKNDIRRGQGTIWKQHVKDLGQKAPEKPPFFQMTAELELYLNKRAGRAATAYYHAITAALQDNALHKPHSSEMGKYPERAKALQRHEDSYGDYDAFYFTKDNALRYGLKTSNFYRHLDKLVEVGVIEVVWRYDPTSPLIRRDGSHAKGWLGKNTPRTIYALSDKWFIDEMSKQNEKIYSTPI